MAEQCHVSPAAAPESLADEVATKAPAHGVIARWYLRGWNDVYG